MRGEAGGGGERGGIAKFDSGRGEWVPGAGRGCDGDGGRGFGRLACSGELRGEMGEAGCALAREKYTWARIADETERIYRGAEARCAGALSVEERLIFNAAK